MDALPRPIDLKRLAAEVSVQHGIRIDPDDPIMAVVTLNRLVFETAVAQVLERVQAAARDFEMAADKVQVRAGGVLAQEVRDSGVAMREEVRKLLEEFRLAGSGAERSDSCQRTRDRKWLVIGLMLALTLFVAGVWVGSRFPELYRF
jgi:hypothetical protein